MILTLRVVALNDQPLGQSITARFDAAGGTIGRADHNTMALPDPERHISRQQAQVTAVAQGYVIRNVGSANPIGVGSLSLSQGESAPLRDGDQLRIGGYLLAVAAEPGDDGATVVRPGLGHAAAPAMPPAASAFPSLPDALPDAMPSAHSRRAPAPGAANEVDPFASLGVATRGDNPFADLLGPGPVHGAGIGLPPAPSPASRPVAPAPGRLPDDFDPFAPPPAAARAPGTPSSVERGVDGPFADLIPGVTRGDALDDLFGLDAPSPTGRDPLAEPGATDPLALFADPPPPIDATPTSMPDDVPALCAAYLPPRARARASDEAPRRLPGHVYDVVIAADTDATPMSPALARDAEPPSASSPAVPRPVEGLPAAVPDDALWRAFCEGAGLRPPPGTRATPELMRLVGRMLRACVDGTQQLMAVRATTRQELRADVTMIQARNNNPLKFSPDGQAALEQMLQPPLRGFMAGPAAMADAMHDLMGHTIGTMAGTRAALEGVLRRFAPGELERQLATRSVLDSLLPGNRKARLWELYLKHFEAIRDEAQEDFHTLFGKAFLEAYERQLERLEQAGATMSDRTGADAAVDAGAAAVGGGR